MTTADVLRHSVEHTHENLAAWLAGARAMADTRAAATQGIRGHRHLPRDRQSPPRRRRRGPDPGGAPRGPPQPPAGARLRARRAGARGDAGAHQGARLRVDVRVRVHLARGMGGGRREPCPAPDQRDHPGRRPQRGTDTRGARRPGRGAAGGGGHVSDPAAPLRPAHRCGRLGVAAGPARRGCVLGHRRGPDGPGARAAGEAQAGADVAVPPGGPAVRRRRSRPSRPPGLVPDRVLVPGRDDSLSA